MIDEELLNHLNKIYETEGFHKVIKTVAYMMELGSVSEEEEGLFKITTAGWSNDEEIVDSLTGFLSHTRKHYVGMLVGGAYYFSDKDPNQYEIRTKALIEEGTDG